VDSGEALAAMEEVLRRAPLCAWDNNNLFGLIDFKGTKLQQEQMEKAIRKMITERFPI